MRSSRLKLSNLPNIIVSNLLHMIDSQIYRIRIGLYAAKGSFRLPNKFGAVDRTDSLDPATGYVSSSILYCILYLLYSIFILYFTIYNFNDFSSTICLFGLYVI